VDRGGESFDNSEYIRMAVGCSATAHVKFGSGLDSTTSPTVSMCERDAEGNCKYKSGVILNQFQRDCCAIAFVKRSRSCIAPTMADDPNGIFQCIELTYSVEPGYITAHVTFFGAYGTDLINNGQVEACLVASHGNGTRASSPYCVLFVVQRCSVCLQPGEGLASVAKRFGSHWTQIYSANPDINGNPDDLEVGQLVRLGNRYTVKQGDTLVALALKFGVSVNQIFYWNPHLVPLPDLGGKVAVPRHFFAARSRSPLAPGLRRFLLACPPHPLLLACPLQKTPSAHGTLRACARQSPCARMPDRLARRGTKTSFPDCCQSATSCAFCQRPA